MFERRARLTMTAKTEAETHIHEDTDKRPEGTVFVGSHLKEALLCDRSSLVEAACA